MIRDRRTTETPRHASKAARAARTAASTSAASASATSACGAPVAGSKTGEVRVDAPAVSAPAMRWWMVRRVSCSRA
jgi:hypothetical protein